MPITPRPGRLSGLFVKTPHVGFTRNAFTFCMYFHGGGHMSSIALCSSAPYRAHYHNFVTHLCSYRLFSGERGWCFKAPRACAVVSSTRVFGHRQPQTTVEYIKHGGVKLVIPVLSRRGYGIRLNGLLCG